MRDGEERDGIDEQMGEARQPDDELFTREEMEKLYAGIGTLFGARFSPGEGIEMWARRDDGHAVIALELATQDRTSVHRFEGAIDVEQSPGLSWDDARFLVLDFVQAHFEEYLRRNRMPPPHRDWRAYDFEGRSLLLRGSAGNEALEAMADRILEQADAAAGSDASSGGATASKANGQNE